jgi:hypothetical protein
MATRIDRLKEDARNINPVDAATIPQEMWALMAHPAISLNRYEEKLWPIAWERNEWGELVPEMSIDLTVDRGGCCGNHGEHGLTVESLTDAQCALVDLSECECSDCRESAYEASYAHEEWA